MVNKEETPGGDGLLIPIDRRRAIAVLGGIAGFWLASLCMAILVLIEACLGSVHPLAGILLLPVGAALLWFIFLVATDLREYAGPIRLMRFLLGRQPLTAALRFLGLDIRWRLALLALAGAVFAVAAVAVIDG